MKQEQIAIKSFWKWSSSKIQSTNHANIIFNQKEKLKKVVGKHNLKI